MVDEKSWVTWSNGRVNSFNIDNSAYRIVRLNSPRIRKGLKAPAHPLEEYDKLVEEAKKQKCCAPVNYPEQIPHSLEKFLSFWEDWNQDGRGSLVLVAPSDYPWGDLEVEGSYIVRLNSWNMISNNLIEGILEYYWGVIFGS